jgi:hypothetical protein
MQLMVLHEFYSTRSWYWGPLGGCEQLIHCVFLSLPIHRSCLLECNVASQYRVPSKACIVPEKKKNSSFLFFSGLKITLSSVISHPFLLYAMPVVVLCLQCKVFCATLYRSKDAHTLWVICGLFCPHNERDLFSCKEN